MILAPPGECSNLFDSNDDNYVDDDDDDAAAEVT